MFEFLLGVLVTLVLVGAYNSMPEDVVVWVDVTPLVRIWRWTRQTTARIVRK